MDLGEPVSVDIVASEGHDDSCYFCNSKEPPREEENEFIDNWDEDADLDGSAESVKFKNDASKLGAAIGGTPGVREIVIVKTVPGAKENTKTSCPVSVAAHHLIPGNAALKNSTLFKSEEYLWVDGKAKGNIGYNVNAAPNGVWLPGNYAMRPWGTGGASFRSSTGHDPKEYAFLAIEKWGAQFHDAHKDYSDFVKDVLDKIYDKLEAKKELWCPEGKKKDPKPDEREPLYVLVSRINTVSSRMKRMLVLPTYNWKKNIYTSRFSLAYMDEKQGHLTGSVK
jgi:hypothetical protein